MCERFVLERSCEAWPHLVDDESIRRIYGLGDKRLLNSPCISIIGARRGTPYGIKLAELVAEVATRVGLTVVSGGALGVDVAASRAALVSGGRTIIVAGTGPDVIYPESNKAVFRETLEKRGACIALEPFGTPPQRWAFSRRNALIAALSDVVVVTESAYKSGTAITVDYALKMNRRVYAFPGSIFSKFSQGNNQLIYDGATMILDRETLEVNLMQDYQDKMRAWLAEGSEGAKQVADYNDKVLNALNGQPLRLSELAEFMGIEQNEMLKRITQYEVKGLVKHMPDSTYALTTKAYAFLPHI